MRILTCRLQVYFLIIFSNELNDKILKCYRQISVMIIHGRNYAMPLTLLLIHQSGPVSIFYGLVICSRFAVHNFSLAHGSMKLKALHASEFCAVRYFHDSRKIFTSERSPASCGDQRDGQCGSQST